MSNIKPIIASLLFVFANGCVEKQNSPTWKLNNGLAQPESVVYDENQSLLYVSNVQGHPMEKDGQGYISIVSLDGIMLKSQWVVKGLNAPKGMAIVGETLYVSDIDALVAININEGEVIARYELEEAKFLNDVTADKTGNVYVSDMLTNTIHCLCNGKFETWLHDDDLISPNGLVAEDTRLIVGTWGIMTDGFATSTAGHLKAVNYTDKKITSLGSGEPVGNLDGVASDGAKGYYVTDWMLGKVFHFDADGKAQEIMQLNAGSADHVYLKAQKLLVIPMMNESELIAFTR